MTRNDPRSRPAAVVLAVLASAWLLCPGSTIAQGETRKPAALSDAEFWRLVTSLSERAGAFPAQLMSNEDSAQFVLPALERSVAPGGIYIGVGSEQNFTYLAALRPRLAFVIDIRRDNLLEMLMYKALFELAETRTAFVSSLFSRPLDPHLLGPSATVAELFTAAEAASPDVNLLGRTTGEVLRRLIRVHEWPLDESDQAAIVAMLDAFRTAGPGGLRGYGDRNPTYAELMALTDLDGRAQSYLATEARFAAVRALQLQNLVVPVVGDFAGPAALPRLGRELATRGDQVDVFYVSNVERYLWQRPDRGQPFYENVRALPLGAHSVFIRSLTADISQRQNIPITPGPARWRTLLVPIHECLDAIAQGRIQSYRDLFLPTAP